MITRINTEKELLVMLKICAEAGNSLKLPSITHFINMAILDMADSAKNSVTQEVDNYFTITHDKIAA